MILENFGTTLNSLITISNLISTNNYNLGYELLYNYINLVQLIFVLAPLSNNLININEYSIPFVKQTHNKGKKTSKNGCNHQRNHNKKKLKEILRRNNLSRVQLNL